MVTPSKRTFSSALQLHELMEGCHISNSDSDSVSVYSSPDLKRVCLGEGVSNGLPIDFRNYLPVLRILLQDSRGLLDIKTVYNICQISNQAKRLVVDNLCSLTLREVKERYSESYNRLLQDLKLKSLVVQHCYDWLPRLKACLQNYPAVSAQNGYFSLTLSGMFTTYELCQSKLLRSRVTHLKIQCSRFMGYKKLAKMSSLRELELVFDSGIMLHWKHLMCRDTEPGQAIWPESLTTLTLRFLSGDESHIFEEDKLNFSGLKVVKVIGAKAILPSKTSDVQYIDCSFVPVQVQA
jgi:hypothetical protein